MHLKQTAFTAAAGKVCTKTGQTAAPRPTKPKRKGKKSRKKGLAGQNLRLSRSAGFRRPESGCGVCQPGGWLGCTLFAGCGCLCGVRLVYALFRNQPQSRVCLVCIQNKAKRGLPSVCTFWRRRFCSWCPPSVCTFSFSMPAAAVSS